jgi:hypothetical protein
MVLTPDRIGRIERIDRIDRIDREVGAAIQQVDDDGCHVDPDRPRGDAVEHEQATHRMHCVRHCAQVVVGQDHAGDSLYMGCEHQVGALVVDRRHDLGDGRWCESRLVLVRDAARFQHDRLGRDLAHLEDLGSACTARGSGPCPAGSIQSTISGACCRHLYGLRISNNDRIEVDFLRF